MALSMVASLGYCLAVIIALLSIMIWRVQSKRRNNSQCSRFWLSTEMHPNNNTRQCREVPKEFNVMMVLTCVPFHRNEAPCKTDVPRCSHRLFFCTPSQTTTTTTTTTPLRRCATTIVAEGFCFDVRCVLLAGGKRNARNGWEMLSWDCQRRR